MDLEYVLNALKNEPDFPFGLERFNDGENAVNVDPDVLRDLSLHLSRMQKAAVKIREGFESILGQEAQASFIEDIKSLEGHIRSASPSTVFDLCDCLNNIMGSDGHKLPLRLDRFEGGKMPHNFNSGNAIFLNLGDVDYAITISQGEIKLCCRRGSDYLHVSKSWIGRQRLVELLSITPDEAEDILSGISIVIQDFHPGCGFYPHYLASSEIRRKFYKAVRKELSFKLRRKLTLEVLFDRFIVNIDGLQTP